MKKIALVLALILSVGIALNLEHTYTRKNCEIVNVENGVVTFEDEGGMLWKWKIEENEYFEIGDSVDLKMYDNHSTITKDDTIKKIIFKD